MIAGSSTSGQASSSSVAATPQLNPFAYSPDPARFPLGRLSTHFAQDGFTECLLVFPRNRVRDRGPFAWSWAATLTFLSGSTTWTCLATKELTTELDSKSLTDFASDPYLATSPIKLRKTNRGYWLAGSGDVESLVSPASDLPSEALTAPTTEQLLPLVRKRKADNLTYDLEQVEKRESEMKEELRITSALRAEMQQELDELKGVERFIEEEDREKKEKKGKWIEGGKEMETEMETEIETEKRGGKGKGKGKEGEEEEMEAENTDVKMGMEEGAEAAEGKDDDDEDDDGGGVVFSSPIR